MRKRHVCKSRFEDIDNDSEIQVYFIIIQFRSQKNKNRERARNFKTNNYMVGFLEKSVSENSTQLFNFQS